jgi:uncharacterized protein with NRDE domain
MCLLLFSWKKNADHDLILAANRDEFYERPTAKAGYWAAHPNLLAGRDLVAGGTWIGVTKSGRFAALTNYRDPKNIDPKAPSRGQLTTDYLISELSPKDYLSKLKDEKKPYNGFNLLIGDADSLFYYNNINYNIKELLPGTYGLSNGLLNDNWPKVTSGKNELRQILEEENSKELALAALFKMLENPQQAEDSTLPKTGVSIEWERTLSPLFIATDKYGTRCSTIITKSKNKVQFVEKSYETPYQEKAFIKINF